MLFRELRSDLGNLLLKLRYPLRGLLEVGGSRLRPRCGLVVGRLQDIPLVRAIKSALLANGAAARSIDAPELIPGIADSDHSSFWRNGVRAAMVTDTAWYRNPRYHTARDTPDTLDYRRMAEVVLGVHAAVVMLAR